MGKKLEKEYVKKMFERHGFKLIGEYIKADKPILCEKNGFKGYLSYNNLMIGRNIGFFKFNNPFFEQNALKIIKKKNDKVEIINCKQVGDKYHKKIIFTLKCECGFIFQKEWGTIKGKKYVECSECIKRKRGKNHRKSKQKAIMKFKEFGYDVLDKKYDFLRNERIKVKDKNGYLGYLSYNHMIAGKGFAIFDIQYNKENYIYNINNYAKMNGINVKAIALLRNGKWTTQGIKFECACGNTFETSISSFRSGKFRCSMCAKSISQLEEKIMKYLDELGVEYIKEYSIYNCRDILPLPFDFYLVNYGKIIEVDGEGHFKPVHFNNISLEDAKKTYDKTVQHDKIKTEYCKKNNIPLLRIPYWEIRNNETYKEKISQFIKD